MKRICEKTGKEFSVYKYTKVLWLIEETPTCPHCKIMKESMGFYKSHPYIMETKRKNE